VTAQLWKILITLGSIHSNRITDTIVYGCGVTIEFGYANDFDIYLA